MNTRPGPFLLAQRLLQSREPLETLARNALGEYGAHIETLSANKSLLAGKHRITFHNAPCPWLAGVWELMTLTGHEWLPDQVYLVPLGSMAVRQA